MTNPSGCSRPAKVLFFDLGGVLVDVCFERLVVALAQLAGESPDAMQVKLQAFQAESQRFDRGEIGSAEFHKCIMDHLHLGLGYDLFCSIYTDIFSLNTETAELALALKNHVRISIISNTDPLHYDYLIKHYPLLKIFEKPVTSFQVRAVKPDAAIYRFALEALQVDAPDALFIDDKPQNIAGAKALGMQGIIFTGAESLRRQLELCFPQIAAA